MQTNAETIEHMSAMPAPTWHFLQMNETKLEIPEGLAIDPSVTVEEPWQPREAQGEFEGAIEAAQAEWEKIHPAPTAEELEEAEAYTKAEADATYGGTARSGYQIGADAMEEARSLAVAFEHGVGEEAAAYLRYAAKGRIVVQTQPGETTEAHVCVSGKAGSLSVAAIDIVAARRSEVNLFVTVDSPEGNGTGFAGTTIRVFADADARVHIVRTQTLDLGYTDIDDMGLFAHDRAHIDVRQTVLGAGSTFTGLAGDLRGDSANVAVDTRYLGHDDQAHDFNYVLRHHGTRTECNLVANGVLAGKSTKTLRGTIDLIRGAKGAQGSENETVLLVDQGVKNKTIPIILCNEDDVAGNHGATIGHIRDEQLFYLSSRGLAPEAAERMFVGAIMEQAAIDAPDAAARAGVLRLGDAVAPGFAELFDEED